MFTSTNMLFCGQHWRMSSRWIARRKYIAFARTRDSEKARKLSPALCVIKVPRALVLLKVRLYYWFAKCISGYRRVSTICDRGEIFAIQYEYWVQQRCNAAKESFRFHRTNDIVKHSIIPAVRQRSYHDNTADDIIRIMFAARRRKIGSLVEEKEDQAGGKRVNFTRERQKFRRTFKAFNIKRPDREREREGKKSELPRR